MSDMTPELLLTAYSQGIFPMAHPDGQIYWYSPDPRAILPLNKLYLSRSLQRIIRQGKYDIRIDTAFDKVIQACSSPGPGRESTWINDEIFQAYGLLHRLGVAHSVEAWWDDELAGGLYGVSLGGFFAGESMFSRQRDASKVALYHLVKHMRERSFILLDVQFLTPHLERLGAIEIPRREYLALLHKAVNTDATF